MHFIINKLWFIIYSEYMFGYLYSNEGKRRCILFVNNRGLDGIGFGSLQRSQ